MEPTCVSSIPMVNYSVILINLWPDGFDEGLGPLALPLEATHALHSVVELSHVACKALAVVHQISVELSLTCAGDVYVVSGVEVGGLQASHYLGIEEVEVTACAAPSVVCEQAGMTVVAV